MTTQHPLKELSPRHKQAMALLAQGTPRQVIAEACDWTPEYITMLAQDPLCLQHLQDISKYVDARFLAMSEKVADVISDTLETGSEKAKLQAVKLQMEATNRIGPERQRGNSGDNGDKLEVLANRLVTLLGERQGNTLPGEYVEVPEPALIESK